MIPELRRLNKQAYGVIKVSSTWWHDRLGHASFSLVEHLLKKNKLPFVVSVIVKQFVIHVSVLRVISYRTLCLQAFPLNLLSSYFLMFGVLALLQLVDTPIT